MARITVKTTDKSRIIH